MVTGLLLTQIYSVVVTQSRFLSAAFVDIFGLPCLMWCPSISEVLEATYKVRLRSLKAKGTLSVQRVLQGSKLETRELLVGLNENHVLPDKDKGFFSRKQGTERNE